MRGCRYWNNSCVAMRIEMADMRMDMVVEYSGMDESHTCFTERSIKQND